MKTFLNFQAEVKSGKSGNVFYIAASDNYFIFKAGEILREKLFGDKNNKDNFYLRYADESPIDEIIDLANNTSSLFSSDKLIILKRTEKYSRKIKELFEFLQKVSNDTFILVVFDKDYVLEKKYQEEMDFYDFSDLPQSDLYAFIHSEFTSRGFKITPDDLEFFISSIPQSIDLLLTEVEKICNYDFEGTDKIITRDIILKFIGYDKEFSPDDLMNSIIKKDAKRSLAILDGLSASAGYSEIYLLSILSNYYMDLITFKTRGFEQKDRGSIYGKYRMWGDRAKFAKNNYKILNINSLETSFNRIMDTDLKLKSTMVNSKILMTSLVEELVNA
jgi:DNA polymerase III delta subunit